VPPTDIIRSLLLPLTFFTIHKSKFSGDAFNPTISRKERGGRFGPLRADRFGYLYVGANPPAAVAERMVRTGLRRARDPRALDYSDFEGLSISELRVDTEFELVGLCDWNTLADWGADAWLVRCDENEYPLTRRWVPYFRRNSPSAVGMAWPSKRIDEWLGPMHASHALIFFGDRCAAAGVALSLVSTDDCQTDGLAIIEAALLALGMGLDGGP
jgi:hypothetical protein